MNRASGIDTSLAWRPSATWWTDSRTGLLVEYEISEGDEPGYDNVRLRLSGEQRLPLEQWEEFKRTAVGAK